MITTSVRDARQHFSQLLNKVEKGEEVIILRHGHIIAHIVPHREMKLTKRLPSLKEFRNSIKVKGMPLSKMIIKERDKER